MKLMRWQKKNGFLLKKHEVMLKFVQERACFWAKGRLFFSIAMSFNEILVILRPNNNNQ